MKVKKVEVKKIYLDMPDIDEDYETFGRDLVKEYVKNKYGKDYSCSVGTYTRAKLKTCIKDFAKVKGLSFDYTNKITKDIDDQIEYTWTDLIHYATKSKALFKFVQDYPDIVHMTKYSLQLCKAESVHPSAVIIVPKQSTETGKKMNIYEWMPIKMIDGVLVSEWEGKYTEASLFLKEDVLGLSQLDKFHNMLNLIEKNKNEKIDVNRIPFNDETVYKFFRKGWCEDVFQFGTMSLMNYCKQVKPTEFSDLVAMTALFRPGPIASHAHSDFAEIKNGKKKPKYDYGIENITSETYSLLVYQEQMMSIIHQLGGLSLIEAENARKYIKKKKHKELAALGDAFVKGAIENGCPEKEAHTIWDKMNAFSSYSFNKCIDGDEEIKLYKNGEICNCSVAELYRQGEYQKYTCLSLSDKRLEANSLVDIRPMGYKNVYQVRLESGKTINVTMNHKFPTETGEKMLACIKVGDRLFVKDAYTLFVHFERVCAIEYVGEKKVYDVEVSGDVSHTFTTSSGIVTSNSHAVAYTLMSYWSQWFKVNYPLEFWTTSLQFASEADIPYRLSEMKHIGVDFEIRQPDVNYSEGNFTCDAENNRIFYSLNKIKGVGEVAVKNILDTRREGGQFFSLEEFLSRVPSKVNKSVVKWLIVAGAFDLLEDIQQPRDRRKLLEKYLIDIKGDKELPKEYNTEEAKISNSFWILEQKRLTGFGEIDYESMLPTKKMKSLYVDDNDFMISRDNTEVCIAGKLLSYTEREIKSGIMCSLQIDVNNVVISGILWPNDYEKILRDVKGNMLDVKGKVICINGTVKKDKFRNQKMLFSNSTTRMYIIS